MPAQFKTYQNRETVKARQVTEKEGETVVTSQGPIIAAYRDYVVLNGDSVAVVNREEFETRYRTPAAKKTVARKTAAVKKTATSAAERIKAARQ